MPPSPSPSNRNSLSTYPPKTREPSLLAAAQSASIPVNASAENVLAASDNMNAEQLARVIAHLNQKLQQKEGSQRKVESTLLLDFLKRARSERLLTIARLNSEVETLSTDIAASEIDRGKARRGVPDSSAAMSSPTRRTSSMASSEPDGHVPRTGPYSSPSDEKDTLFGIDAKLRRVSDNFEDLQSLYFSTVGKSKGDARRKSLRRFTDDIVKVTQFSRFRCRASLLHVAQLRDAPGTDVFKASNIVSSIEFDRKSEMLATAGVTKRIKIFDFSNVIQNIAEVDYPVQEIATHAKLSWVCWNPYIRHHLVSSDYEGIVTLWDVSRGTLLSEYEEHEKRAWSVDFCTANPQFFASGSDDGRVKLWNTGQSNSVMTIENGRANICSVKFEPGSTERLAFGSADYNVHYFDIRNPRTALKVFKSHERTVSYVKFMLSKELVSASVDSTIKLWDLNEMQLKRTFTGHVNDKNFVGLTVTDDYIACGSEENSIYAYYKGIPHPFAQYRFPNADPLTGGEAQDDDESFVSSVCWCPKRPTMLVGANSLGVIKVLDLAEEAQKGDSQDSSDEL